MVKINGEFYSALKIHGFNFHLCKTNSGRNF